MLFWVGRDPKGLLSPTLRWMTHVGIKATTLALLCSNHLFIFLRVTWEEGTWWWDTAHPHGFCIATNWRCGGSEADRLPCSFSIQRDSGTLEKWTDWNLMKFNKDKCKSLTWEGRAPCSDRGWGSVVGKQLCGKGLRVLGGWLSWTSASIMPCQPCRQCAGLP